MSKLILDNILMLSSDSLTPDQNAEKSLAACPAVGV